jgi:uncharacterized membrane protein YeiH
MQFRRPGNGTTIVVDGQMPSPAVLVVAVASSLTGVLFDTILGHSERVYWFVDMLSLGLFEVAGLQRAQAAPLSVTSSVFLGVVTCVGGGVVREVLCRETPRLLLPGQPYR